MKIGINDISIDDDIYPRIRKSQQTIDQYTEALRAGAEFPAIEVQKISIDGTEQIIILDGLHRLEAYKVVHKQPELEGNGDFSLIEAKFWKDEVLDKKENLNLLRLRSAALNSQHGDRMTNADYQALAEKIAIDDPEHKLSSKTIAKEWGLHPRTVRNWVQSIRAKQKAKRDRIIFKLSMLGWTQEEIAELAKALGVSISTVQRWEYNVTKVRKVYELAIGSLTLWAEYILKKGDGAFDIPSKAEMKRQVIALQNENEKLRKENEHLTHRVAALANTIAKWVCTPTRELKKLIVGREEGIVGVIKDWLRDGELTL